MVIRTRKKKIRIGLTIINHNNISLASFMGGGGGGGGIQSLKRQTLASNSGLCQRTWVQDLLPSLKQHESLGKLYFLNLILSTYNLRIKISALPNLTEWESGVEGYVKPPKKLRNTIQKHSLIINFGLEVEICVPWHQILWQSVVSGSLTINYVNYYMFIYIYINLESSKLLALWWFLSVPQIKTAYKKYLICQRSVKCQHKQWHKPCAYVIGQSWQKMWEHNLTAHWTTNVTWKQSLSTPREF